MSRKRSIVRWAARLAVVAVLLGAAAVFVVPRLLDLPAVQARLEQWASRAVQGEVTWEHLEVRLFPAPHGLMRGARIDVPGKLTAAVERVELGLRLWPLLGGRVEIDSVSVLRPSVHIQLPASREPTTAPDPLAAYRAALRPAVDATQRLMPEGVVVLEGARLELNALALAIDARLASDAQGVSVEGTVSSERWGRMQLAGRVASLDLSANATMTVSGVKLQEALQALAPGAAAALVLPDASARVEARTNAQDSLDAAFRADLPAVGLRRGDRQLDLAGVRFEGTARLAARDLQIALSDFRLGEVVPSGRATLRLAGAQRAPQASLEIDALDVARLRTAVLAIAGDHAAVREYVARVAGGKVSEVRISAQSDTLKTLVRLPNLSGSLRLSGGEMRLPILEKPASGIGAQLVLDGGTLRARKTTGRVGQSVLTDGAIDIALGAPRHLEASGGQASLAVDELVTWLRTQERLADAMKAVQNVSGVADATVHRLQLRFDKPGAATYDVTVRPRRLRAEIAGLPATTIDGGSLRVSPDALTFDRVGAAALDATARISGTVSDYRAPRLRVEASADDAAAGSEAIAWIWQRAGLPAHGRPATPLRLSAPRVQWSEAGLDAAVQVKFPAGLRADADFGIRGKSLDIRRLALKDAESDAVLRLAQRGPLLDAGFAGVLTGASVASMLAEATDGIPGDVRGDLQVTYDTERPGRSTAKGSLAAERVDLGVFLPVPLRLERADLQVDGTVLRMREVSLDWSGQRATLRGEIAQRPGGLEVQAELDSPGVDFDALLPAPQPMAGAQPLQWQPPDTRKLWPLPVTGSVAVRAGFLQYHGRRVEPLRATLVLEPQRAHLKVAEAALCGIAFPFSVSARPEHVEAAVRLSAKDQELESVAQCLSSQQVQITGRFDLAAELAAEGKLSELMRVIEGSVKAQARGGEIRKFALLGNILSLTNVKSVLENEVDLGRDAFGYRGINVLGRFGGSRFTLDEGALRSDALGLAVNGEIGFDFQSRLTVLVAPFSRLDRAVRSVPIVGYVVGGVFTSIPVGVSGDIRDPLVVPLGPRAITSELLGIFERTLKLPAKLVAPLEAERPAK